MTQIIDPHRQRSALFAVLLVALTAVPMLLSPTPALLDLPAHISRYYVQDALARSPALAQYFTYQWHFIPNLGMDVLMVPLTRLFGFQAALSILIASIPALMVAGMLAIARVIHGRIPATGFFALPLAYSYPLTFGFVNSCLSVSLAFVAFALWLHLTKHRRLWWRAAAFAVIAPMILTAHIIGYGVLGVLIGGSIIGDNFAARTSIKRTAIDIVIGCAPLVWPLLFLLFWRQGSAAYIGNWFNWQTIGIWLTTILRDHYRPLDLASAGVVYLVAALPIIRPARFAYRPELGVPAALFWLMVFAMPATIFGSEFASVRLLPVACAMAILAVRPRTALPPSLTIAALAFFAIRLVSTGSSMIAWDHRFKSELAALDHVAVGSTIAAYRAVECDRRWDPPRLQHLASLATVRRDAYVNDQFEMVQGQLLGIRYADHPRLHGLGGSVVSIQRCSRWPLPSLAETIARLPWDAVDYLWLIDVNAADRPNDPRLQPLWQNDHSIIYRITKTSRHPG